VQRWSTGSIDSHLLCEWQECRGGVGQSKRSVAEFWALRVLSLYLGQLRHMYGPNFTFLNFLKPSI
jgi:hypothetical protein